MKYSLEKKVFHNGILQIENYVPRLQSEEALAFDHAEIVALCDDYPPNLKEAHALYPKAKTYTLDRKLDTRCLLAGTVL